MSFVYPFLLGGLALASVPILLHLIMRQKPKHLLFPAFRFLLQRHRTNLRKLRLRHLLLLTLRVLLIAAICFALAQPKAKTSSRANFREQPIAAVLLVDTSARMGYVLPGEPGYPDPTKPLTILSEAKRRAGELLGQFHADSRIVLLDTAHPKKIWLSRDGAQERIKRLGIRPDNIPVTERLADAYALLEKLARDRDEVARNMPRFVFVFSDRTKPSWDTSVLKKRQEEADRIPPPLERLQGYADRIGPLVETLRALAERLQVSGGPVLVEQLQQLKDYIPTAALSEYPDPTGSTILPKVRAQARELIRRLQLLREDLPKEVAEFRSKALRQLHELLRDLKGAYEVYVDVGVENPMNLAVENLELYGLIGRGTPRQVFAAREKISVQATVRATGDTYTQRVDCLVDGGKLKIAPQGVKNLSPGRSAVITFEIDCKNLEKGLHHVEVKVPHVDTLTYDDARYATFEIRDARKVLTIVDDVARARIWKKGVQYTGIFECDVLSTADALGLAKERWNDYKAVCLFEVTVPSKPLWAALEKHVDRGGNLVVVPPGDLRKIEETKEAYNVNEIAQRLLPGRLNQVIDLGRDNGVEWSWQSTDTDYSHPILQPFKRWRQDPNIDFVKAPRWADRYWEVKPKEGNRVSVLVRYQDKEKHPAVLENRLANRPGQQRVLLFSTTLDGDQAWNNFMESGTWFWIVLPDLTMKYMVGTITDQEFNFLSGQPVRVALPLKGRRPPYYVEGPGLEDASSTLEADPKQNELRIRGAVQPGNYPVYDNDRNRVAGFSVNVPPADLDLSRVPEEQVSALFGPEAILPAGGDVNLLDVLQEQWSQPWDLLPLLLILLLVLLVTESFLANKFYRRAPDDRPEPAPVEPANS
jgi:hypothetical protein